MKRMMIWLTATVFILGGLTACGAQQEPASAQIFAMDTVMELTAYGDGAEEAVDAGQAQIYALEAMFTRTRADSEISQLNEKRYMNMGRTVFELLRAAVTYTEETGGAFDITVAPIMSAWGFTKDEHRVPDQDELNELLAHVGAKHIFLSDQESNSASTDLYVQLSEGTQIDLGGIAKGYTSDCMEAVFWKNGVKSGKVVLGGNIYVQGMKPDGTPWRIGVQDPNNSERYAAILELSDVYAVTSGGYQRYFEEDGRIYHHIIDPATGYPAESNLVSVTVVADANGADYDGSVPGNGAMCDAFSTALFVMGETAAIEFWRNSGCQFDLILVTEDDRVVITEGLADALTEIEGSGYKYETVS